MDRRSLLGTLPGLALAVNAFKEKTWTLMALGDSITAGGKLFHSYRGPLDRMLDGSGSSIRWVGTQSTPEDEPQLRHEGYPGKPIEYLSSNIRKVYSAHPADIILLHAGHNHTVEEHPVSGIVKNTELIVRYTREINRRVIILLAQVIPSGKLPKYAYIPTLNEKLAQLPHRLSSRLSPIIPVNQAAHFDPLTDTIEDRVHPNAKGAEKMAREFSNALRPILNK
jgi:lysophospholipase L1-like esterase